MEANKGLLIFIAAALTTVGQAQDRGPGSWSSDWHSWRPNFFAGKWVVTESHSSSGNPRVGTKATIHYLHGNQFIFRFHDSDTKYRMTLDRGRLHTDPGQRIWIDLRPMRQDQIRYEVRYREEGAIGKSGILARP